MQIKVLHYVDADSLSWLVPYIEHIKSLEVFGVDSTLLCRPGGDIARAASENGLKVCTWKPLIASMPVLSPEFLDIIKKISPDIIHTRLSSAASIAGYWSRQLGVPVVSTFDKPAKAKYYKHSAHCIACAGWLRDYMTNSQGIGAEKIDVIHNPVNISRFARNEAKRKEFRKLLGISDNEILLSGMGIYIYRKGFDILIRAFSKVQREFNQGKNLRLSLIGGEGEKGQREAYKKLADDCGIKIIMPDGFVRDVRDWLWASDIFVMPSREEGFSIALLEGLAAGLPVIVSDIAPFTEIIVNENNGLVAAKDNPDSFADAMLEMLEIGTEGRNRLAQNALATIEKNFTLEASAEKTYKIYRRILDSKMPKA